MRSREEIPEQVTFRLESEGWVARKRVRKIKHEGLKMGRSL